MTGSAQLSPTQSDADRQLFKLTLTEVMQRFSAAGLPRSYRTIQRYCESERLDAMKTDSATVLYDPAKVTIEQLKQAIAEAGFQVRSVEEITK